MASSARRKKKSVPKSTSEMSQETLREILKKKKECNSKALAVVERLCEPSLPDEKWFLANLAYINQSHFEDVIVERAISKLCGYPLCKNVLENVPSKKYHISTKLNKVFDITERKNFCSNNCYKAGMYIKNQLLTSPLWFRDQEIIPVFKLLASSSSSGSGDEVVFLPEREQLRKDVLAEETKEANDSEKLEKKLENIHLETGEDKDNIVKEPSVTKESIDNFVFYEQPTREKEPSVIGKSEGALGPVKKVEKFLFEWFTLDTVLYLYGEDKVKEIMKDKKEKVKEILDKKPLAPGFDEKLDVMMKFYSMLDDDEYDCEVANKNLKPLPDYSAIKEDGKRLEVKVRAFYSGQLEIKESDVVSDKTTGGEDAGDEGEVYLPAVDAHAQNSLRIKILLDRLNRIVPELIRTFTNASCFNIGELKALVSHFKLSAHNITFRPGEWDLVGFIIIKLLSLKNKQMECLLKREKAKTHVTLFLMNYGLPADYLDNVVEWLMNGEDLIKKLDYYCHANNWPPIFRPFLEEDVADSKLSRLILFLVNLFEQMVNQEESAPPCLEAEMRNLPCCGRHCLDPEDVPSVS